MPRVGPTADGHDCANKRKGTLGVGAEVRIQLREWVTNRDMVRSTCHACSPDIERRPPRCWRMPTTAAAALLA